MENALIIIAAVCLVYVIGYFFALGIKIAEENIPMILEGLGYILFGLIIITLLFLVGSTV